MQVAAVTLPVAGHMTPMTGLVGGLAGRGAQVVAVNRDPIEGAASHHALPLPLGFDVDRPPRSLSATAALLARLTSALVPGTRAALRAHSAQIVVTDAMASWGRVAALAEGLPFVTLSTTFAVHATSAPPGMALGELREPRAALRALRAVARERRAVRAEHGVDLGDAMSLFASRRNAAGVVVATARVLQPRPAMIERDAPVLFAGCLRNLDADTNCDDLGEGPFVLVSLGTMFEERPEIFAACVAALRDRPEAVVVAHGRTDPATIGEPGPRTVLRSRVPQVALLARSRAFVSHGGLNSVTEALWHGVPLVLLPQAADQPLNADRIERLGAGLWVRDPTAATIRSAVERVLADPSYTRAARALGDRLRASAGPGQAADFVLRTVCASEMP